MGQYYNAIRINPKTYEIDNYDLQIKNSKNRTGLKLTEHSWWDANFMVAFSATLVNSPAYVGWWGDYTTGYERAMQEIDPNIEEIVNSLWVETEAFSSFPLDYGFVLPSETTITQYNEQNPLNVNKYLVNHTKKVFIDLQEYYNSCVDEDCRVMHPLSLLTATSNDKGGGDFYSGSIGYEHVGTWTFNLIEISNNDFGYEKVNVRFIEKY